MKPGDVVRIGDLPAGAVVDRATDAGLVYRVTVTSDSGNGGRGRYVELHASPWVWVVTFGPAQIGGAR